MAIREDLVSSAVTFLQDPSVANSPMERRVAFLQSKNLTQEEVDAALSRAADPNSAAPPGNYAFSQQGAVRQASAPPQYGYSPYQQGPWQQPPPDLPRRDWRDYFIMATVMSGVGYGLYFVAKRYIVPLVAPPTPPQLEQDKAAIDTSFERAFSLIDQLSKDTAEIKASEEARKERLDSALTEVELAITELKVSSRRRDDDGHRISDEVRALQGMIPKAIKTHEESTDARLKELNAELKSLKTLIANRVTAPTPPRAANDFNQNTSLSNGSNGTQADQEPGTTSTGPLPTRSTGTSSPSTNGPSPYGKLAGSKGGIPAWQLAASKRAEEQKKDTAESGTVVDTDQTVA